MQVKDHTSIGFALYTVNYIRSSDILPLGMGMYLKRGFKVLGYFPVWLAKSFVVARQNKVAGAFHKQEMVSQWNFR
jgi:hypothetical protein